MGRGAPQDGPGRDGVRGPLIGADEQVVDVAGLGQRARGRTDHGVHAPARRVGRDQVVDGHRPALCRGQDIGSGAGAEQSATGAEGRGRRAWRQLLGCRVHDQHGRGAALGQVRQRSLSLAAAGQDPTLAATTNHAQCAGAVPEPGLDERLTGLLLDQLPATAHHGDLGELLRHGHRGGDRPCR